MIEFLGSLFFKDLTCAYCGEVKQTVWRWQGFTAVDCDCSGMRRAKISEMRKRKKIIEKRITTGQYIRQKPKYCLECGKGLHSFSGQIRLYCSKECRQKARHRKEKNESRQKIQAEA